LLAIDTRYAGCRFSSFSSVSGEWLIYFNDIWWRIIQHGRTRHLLDISICVFLEVRWTKGVYTYCIINTHIYVFIVLLHIKVLSSKLLIIAFNCCQQAAPTTKIILHIKEVFFLRPLHFIFISYWKFSGIIWSCPFFQKQFEQLTAHLKSQLVLFPIYQIFEQMSFI